MFDTISSFFNSGGTTMYVTATAGVIGVAISVERFLKLYKEYNFDNRGFLSKVKELMMQERVEDAIQYCSSENSPMAKVIKSGLERSGCDEQLVRQSMESTYLEQTPKFSEKIGYLALIANVGMLFGLLGTVLGLIAQFSAVAQADAAQKQELLASGIAEAMNSTALGLMVAIPMLIVHGIFSAKANSHIDDLEKGASEFLDWVNLQNYGQLQNRLSKSGVTQIRKAGNV